MEPETITFTVKILVAGEAMPSVEAVSAVFLIALSDNKIVAIRNYRGWDIPGGHVEPGEGLLEALQREAREEASMVFKNPIPFATMTSISKNPHYIGKCIVGFAVKEFEFQEFVPAVDSYERKLMDIEEFFSLYQLDKENIRQVIAGAHSLLF